MTPGPWSLNPHFPKEIYGPSGVSIADASDEDDARLIAAAPELLAALEDVLETTGSTKTSAAAKAAAKVRARAAIARAKGETK